MAVAVKALFFDVFGTLVDWRTSIARETKAMLEPQGYKLDWLAFADAWRGEYQGAMDEVRSGRIPFCKLDVLHRRNLEHVLPRFGIDKLSEDDRRTLNLAWHRLDAWPDVPPGLHRLKRRYMLAPVSNGNISLMVALARRNDLPWDAILGSEIAGDYKPKPRVYLAAAEALDLPPHELHDGRRPHQGPDGRGGARAAHRTHRAPQRARPGPRRDRAQRARRCRRLWPRGFGWEARDVIANFLAGAGN